jgi:hypothetical protein
MNADELRALQAPLKTRYRDTPDAAIITLKAAGELDSDKIVCKVDTGRALVEAGRTQRPVAMASPPVRATCCSKRSSPAPA